MCANILKNTAFVLVALFVLVACSQQPTKPTEPQQPTINLLKQADAARFILERLRVDGNEPITVKLYPQMISPYNRVTELGTDYVHTARNHEWFAFVDRFPGAYFPHQVEYAFLDYKTQEIEIALRQHVPLIDGKLVWVSLEQFQSDDDVIFERSGPEGVVRHGLAFPPREKSQLRSPMSLPQAIERAAMETGMGGHVRRYALLLHNTSPDDGYMHPLALSNLEQLAVALRANGFEVQEYASEAGSGDRKPYIDISREGGYGLYQLRHFIKKHQDRADESEEILIYLTGTTGLEDGQIRPKTYFDVDFAYGGERSQRPAQRRFYGEDLKDLLRPLASRHINVVVDANYSGGFIDELYHMASIETAIAACGRDELAYTAIYEAANGGEIKDPYGKPEGETGSEFTSGFIKGLIDAARGEAGLAERPAAAELVGYAYNEAIRNDIAAIASQTHPIGYSRYVDR